MKGSALLKVTSIIMIIFAGFSVIGSILILAGGGLLAGMDDLGIGGDALGAIVMIAGIIALISSGFQLVVGIIGVTRCKNPEGAKLCFILGLIILILGAITIIVNLVSGTFSILNLLSLVLPGLYTYGAYQLKSNA